MKKLLLFLILSLLLATPCQAVETGELEEALPEEAREILGDLTVAEAAGGGVFSAIRDRALGELSAAAGRAARSACIQLAVTLLCSVGAAVSRDGRLPPYMLLGGALAILGACAGDFRSYLGQTRAVIDELSDFSRALLPCVAAASAAAGDGAAGAARYTVSMLFFDVLLTAGRDLILPMIYACGAVSAANAALPEGGLSGPARLLKWLCTVLLTGLTTAFTLALSLSGIVAGGAGRLAGSAAKTVISAALPVVGKIVADAAETYLAGARLLRAAVGVFGLAAVLCVCLGPFLGLGLHYLLFKAAAMVSEPFSDSRLSKLVGDLASCYGMALALLGSAAVMLFMSAVAGTEAMGL